MRSRFRYRYDRERLQAAIRGAGILCLSALALYAQPGHQPKPLSVCELLAHRSEYADQVVTVRGEIRTGAHGIFLAAGPECSFRLVTRGVTWQNVIYLSYPYTSKQSRDPTDRADFGIDWNSEKELASQIAKLRFTSKNDRLFETVAGLFRTYADLENRVNPMLPPGSDLRTLGFGPGGYAPGKLLIKTRMDPAVVHQSERETGRRPDIQ